MKKKEAHSSDKKRMSAATTTLLYHAENCELLHYIVKDLETQYLESEAAFAEKRYLLALVLINLKRARARYNSLWESAELEMETVTVMFQGNITEVPLEGGVRLDFTEHLRRQAALELNLPLESVQIDPDCLFAGSIGVPFNVHAFDWEAHDEAADATSTDGNIVTAREYREKIRLLLESLRVHTASDLIRLNEKNLAEVLAEENRSLTPREVKLIARKLGNAKKMAFHCFEMEQQRRLEDEALTPRSRRLAPLMPKDPLVFVFSPMVLAAELVDVASWHCDEVFGRQSAYIGMVPITRTSSSKVTLDLLVLKSKGIRGWMRAETQHMDSVKKQHTTNVDALEIELSKTVTSVRAVGEIRQEMEAAAAATAAAAMKAATGGGAQQEARTGDAPVEVRRWDGKPLSTAMSWQLVPAGKREEQQLLQVLFFCTHSPYTVRHTNCLL
jgi:hypothetical protein